jgi:hypothetical protein
LLAIFLPETKNSAHVWHTWPLLRIGFTGGSSKGRLTGVQYVLLSFSPGVTEQSSKCITIPQLTLNLTNLPFKGPLCRASLCDGLCQFRISAQRVCKLHLARAVAFWLQQQRVTFTASGDVDSLIDSFSQHVTSSHPADEDFSQAAARIVKEATKD